jgi:hypothetical protein
MKTVFGNCVSSCSPISRCGVIVCTVVARREEERAMPLRICINVISVLRPMGHMISDISLDNLKDACRRRVFVWAEGVLRLEYAAAGKVRTYSPNTETGERVYKRVPILEAMILTLLLHIYNLYTSYIHAIYMEHLPSCAVGEASGKGEVLGTGGELSTAIAGGVIEQTRANVQELTRLGNTFADFGMATAFVTTFCKQP